MNHPAPAAALDSNRPSDPAWFRHVLGHYQIGRASCRERV